MIEKVGLTGLNASGKGEAARILEKYGYSYVSLSDIVREEASRRGLDHSRESLINTGNGLRQEKGAGVLAVLILERLDKYSVIDSIRNPEEVQVLKTAGDFILLGIRADSRTRFERMKKRGRIGDALTFEEFILMEEREQSNSEYAQQLHLCLDLADMYIDNDETLDSLELQIIKACGIEESGK